MHIFFFLSISAESLWKVTCFGLHRKVRLSLQYAVNHSSTVAVSRIICISGCHLNYRGTCKMFKELLYIKNPKIWITLIQHAVPIYIWNSVMWLFYNHSSFPCWFSLEYKVLFVNQWYWLLQSSVFPNSLSLWPTAIKINSFSSSPSLSLPLVDGGYVNNIS